MFASLHTAVGLIEEADIRAGIVYGCSGGVGVGVGVDAGERGVVAYVPWAKGDIANSCHCQCSSTLVVIFIFKCTVHLYIRI